MKIEIDNAWRQVQSIANDVVTLLPNVLLGAAILFLAYVVSRYAATLVRKIARRAGQNDNVGLLLGRLATYVVMLFGFLVALSTVFPSFRAKDLIQVLGIGGVAVGFAFKDIFQNFLAGVIILVSRPFRIGDTIAVKGYEGTVEDIQTRATMIRTADNQRIVIPNSTVFTQEVKVVTAYESRRTEVEFALDYAVDVAVAKSRILEAIRSVEGVEASPAPDVLAMNLGDSGVVLRMRYWVANSGKVLETRDHVVSGVKAALDAAGIAFPVQTVVVRRPDGASETEGDDASSREDWARGEND